MTRYVAGSTGLLLLAMLLTCCSAARHGSIAANMEPPVSATHAYALDGTYDPYHYRCADRCLSAF